MVLIEPKEKRFVSKDDVGAKIRCLRRPGSTATMEKD